ncbi:MAG TPA: sporulation protein YqfD [Defluviitaleaceae bacterium]|nr:sporulation protein YqfD [Defluviitaleaceae bacterium]
MFLSVWNYLRGYVTIEVSGFSVERFMNLASHKGIYLWDIKKYKSKIQMKVSIKGFKLLKSCAKKTKCKIVIVEKKGCPFFIHKYRKRKVMAAGVLIFFGLLYFLSSFIWLIEIKGNERIDTEELIKALENYGVKTGVLKMKVNADEVEGFLRDSFPDIAWTAAEIKGTRLTIELTETVEKPLIVDRTTPCNLVAQRTGLIVSVTTRAGTPKVKANDVVKKGDLLVSGEIIIKDDEEGTLKKYVHADADVLAKTRYELSFDQPLYYMEKQYTNNIKKQHAIKIFDKELKLYNKEIDYSHYDKIIDQKQLSLSKYFVLPLYKITYEYREYTPVKHKRTIEEAKQLAEEEIRKKLLEEISDRGEVVSSEIKYYPKEDCLKAKAVFTILEHIEEVQAINREEFEDGANRKNLSDTN